MAGNTAEESCKTHPTASRRHAAGLVMNTGVVLLHRAGNKRDKIARGVNNKVIRGNNGGDQEVVVLVLSYLRLLWMDGGFVFAYAGGELKDTIPAAVLDDLDGRYNNALRANTKTHSKLTNGVR